MVYNLLLFFPSYCRSAYWIVHVRVCGARWIVRSPLETKIHIDLYHLKRIREYLYKRWVDKPLVILRTPHYCNSLEIFGDTVNFLFTEISTMYGSLCSCNSTNISLSENTSFQTAAIFVWFPDQMIDWEDWILHCLYQGHLYGKYGMLDHHDGFGMRKV